MGVLAANQLPMSKFAFCDLALESAIQLESLKGGKDWDVGPVRTLADVLIKAARPADREVPASFIEASYYEPFERLTRKQQGAPQSVRDIKEFFGGAAEMLKSLEKERPSDEYLTGLVKFCVNLHRELVRELKMEDLAGARQRPTSDIAS